MLRVGDVKELQAASYALKNMDKDIRNLINRETRRIFNPVWKNEVESRARTRVDNLVIARGSRVSGGNPPTLYAATSKRRMRGGLVPAEQWRGFEFGSKSRGNKRQYTGTSPKGKRYTVSRRTQRQMPASRPKGRIVYPAVAEVAPRLAALWTQLIVKKTYDAIEGK